MVKIVPFLVLYHAFSLQDPHPFFSRDFSLFLVAWSFAPRLCALVSGSIQ